MTQGFIHISSDDLRTFTTEIFERLGLSSENPSLVSDCLVKANLRGVDSHGVSRIPIYAKRLRLKLVNPRPNIQATRVAPAVSLVDGDDGMDMIVGTCAMAEAIAIARGSGIGLTGVGQSTHYGMAAYYVLQAISEDFIGFAFTNASPGMPPWGGSKPVLGVNPIAVGVPAGQQPPFVLDMAMSIVARGKMRLAGLRGEPIPAGIGLYAQGRPTTDGLKVLDGGRVNSFGGYKGSGLALWMEIMGGVFTGAAFAGEIPSLYGDFSGPTRIGHVFMAIRPNLFMSIEEFKDRVDTMMERYRSSPKAQGFDEILMPGEREEAKRCTTGIPVPPEIAEELRREAGELGISFPNR